MAFGRRKREQDGGATPEGDQSGPDRSDDNAEGSVQAVSDPTESALTATGGDFEGPFDIDDFDDPEEAVTARLDLGSVLIPTPPGGQVQVEFNQTGVPSAIWVVTPNGRFTIAAYAAPKSPGLWREVAGELADALRNDNAAVSIEDGPWGREVVGTGAGAVRFIGVDGYRWMIRCVANGGLETMPQLVAQAREALADTVVRRDATPLPVRTPLPVQLPEPLAAQLRAAAAQQAEQAQAQQAMIAAQQAALAQQQQQQQPHQQPESEPDARRTEPGASMRQVRSTSTSTGG